MRGACDAIDVVLDAGWNLENDGPGPRVARVVVVHARETPSRWILAPRRREGRAATWASPHVGAATHGVPLRRLLRTHCWSRLAPGCRGFPTRMLAGGADMSFGRVGLGSGPRIAVSFGASHPSPSDQELRVAFEGLVDRCGGEFEVFYNYAPDLLALTRRDRDLVGSGVFVPGLYDLDLAHFRRVAPARTAELLAILGQVLGSDEQALLARYDVRSAFPMARWMQAHGVQVACSHGFRDISVTMCLASCLLSVPWVLLACPARVDGDEAIFRMLLERAAAVVPATADAVAEFVAQHQHRPEGWCALPLAVDGGASIGRRLRHLLSERPAGGALSMGAAAAYVGEPTDALHSSGLARPFVILGAERTGSNLLVETLGVQAGIGCAGEIFNPRLIAEGACPWLTGDLPPDVLQRIRGAHPAAMIRELLREAAGTGKSWGGFKLLYFHGVADPRVLRALFDHSDLRIVHQVRANRLQRWLSHCRASVSDRWYAVKGEARERRVPALTLNLNDTLYDFVYQQSMESLYRSIFDGREILEVDYEDMVSLPRETLSRLGRFFELEPSEVEPQSEKTGGSSLRSGIENYDEVAGAFEGTRWHGLFCEPR